MEMTAPGFLRPVQAETLTKAEENTVAQICPGLGQRVDSAGRIDDPLWGPYLDMRTGHATDPEIRFIGSSGGGLSAVAAWLLDSGAVDGVVETTAHAEVAVANQPLLARNRSEILAGAGSRYATSAPLTDLAAVLEGTTRHAFIGKPCDVAALRALAALDPRVGERIPYMLSFFCAGVPSQTGAEAVLTALGTTLDETAGFRFRGNGWPGQATATDRDGAQSSMSYHDSWGKILSRHVQHRCKICADGTGVAADLVCADAWESDTDGYPLFEEQDGTSLMVARTEVGLALIRQAEAAGAIATADFDVPSLTGIQPGQRRRRRALLARLAGLRLMGFPVPDYRGLLLRAAARQNNLKDNAKNFLGMVRRALKGRQGLR